MALSDREIHKYLEDGELVILGPQKSLPFDLAAQVQPSSIDLRLDQSFVTYKDEITEVNIKDLGDPWKFLERISAERDSPVILPPRSIVFGQIYEQLKIPSDTYGRVVGRSRFARLGLSVHATGDFINPDFEGAMPLQLINHTHVPMILYPFITICQLILTKITSKPLIPYPDRSDNPYMREDYAGPSMIHTDPIFSKSDRSSIRQERESRLLQKYKAEMSQDKRSIIMGNQVNISGSNINASQGSKVLVGNFDIVAQKMEHSGAIALATMFKELVHEISQTDDIPESRKEELVEIIEHIGKEVSKPNKNKTIIRSLGEGLAESLKLIPDFAKSAEALSKLLSPYL